MPQYAGYKPGHRRLQAMISPRSSQDIPGREPGYPRARARISPPSRHTLYLKKAKNKSLSPFCVCDMGNRRIFAVSFNQLIDRMNETERLIQQITEGIQDKKGKNIVIADLTKIEDTICNYFVICQGNSPSQVTAIVESVKDFARKGANAKPSAIDGLRNAEWVAMDYADILVHVFLPETRNFYNLETLWADAKLTQVPDLD